MARSTADFASTTSMVEGRLRLRTASMPGEDPDAALFLLSAIAVYVDLGRRGGKEGGASMTVSG